MRILNSFFSKAALAMVLMAGLVLTADYNKVAHAEDTDPFELPGQFNASIAFVSEYRYRGLDQSQENAAIQGSMDWSHEKGFYLGVWASNVNFVDTASAEFDIYAGVAREYYGITFDIGLLYYTYPSALDDLKYDFLEYHFGISTECDLLSLSAAVNYAPEFYAGSGNATYMSFDAGLPLAHGVSLTGHAGYQWLTNAATYGVGNSDPSRDYADWSVGLGYTTNGFDLSITYVDTDLTEADKSSGADGTAVFGISRSF
jgi:uncharacterized protein (TIGR02001 family)